ncbi:peptidase [Altererythrobacter xixiisoli]|uniref:Peptidase n=1 Tax=Croceibacterium xixiisoli TaxID=1476466 RepID=A0A6I4TSJ1_9SPHN|nr:SapC family protein [Croceibacterium xixiisoli]MXO97578.1 peptidase [Croceibacterium xixiisoli]
MADTPASTAPAGAPLQPLFYQALQPLNSQLHADWRLADGDAGFAETTPFVPLVVGELAAAARSYPIVFAADSAQPVAVLGLERRNLFVQGGRWLPDAYVPAYVRRYPFAFVATINPDGFALAIDSGSDRVLQNGSDGTPLFVEGKPSELTSQALAFCDAFQAEAAATAAFLDALKAQNLLIDRRADATLPDGRKLGLDGFQVVDAEKFANLADDVVLDWHRRGWLALVHFHLASLERFGLLLSRQAGLADPATPVTPMSSDAASAAPTSTHLH